MTGVAITYWWFNTALWIFGLALVWTCCIVSLLLFVRTVLILVDCRRRISLAPEPEVRRRIYLASKPTRYIDAWRHDVEDAATIVPSDSASQATFDRYTDEETPNRQPQAASLVSVGTQYNNEVTSNRQTRAASAVSTVAHWTTVSGTNTLVTQFTETPPLYSRPER